MNHPYSLSIVILGTAIAGIAKAGVPERAKELATAEPGLSPVGEVLTDIAAKKHYKRDWNVELEKDHCYVLGIAGDSGVEKLAVTLYDPSDDKAASDSAKTNEVTLKHCAFENGRYRVNVNIKDGMGSFALAVYGKGNSGVAGLQGTLDKVAAQQVPGATRLGEPYSARGESGLISNKESKWPVSWELGKCYAAVMVGEDSVRGLRLKLLDKDGAEVAPKVEGATHTTLSLCPGKTDQYTVVASVTKGSGGVLVGLYQKAATEEEKQAAKKGLEDKATGGFAGCPNGEDPGCDKKRDGKSAMQAADYADVVGEMRKKSGDDDRVAHLRKALTKHFVTVMQLSHMLEFISDDKNKLAVVEAGARHVVDPDNANVIRNGFGWKHMANKAYSRIVDAGKEKLAPHVLLNASLIATSATALTVVVGIVFGVLTLRQWHRTRYLSAAAELVHTIQTSDFTRSIARVMDLPEKAAAASVLGSPDLVGAVYTVSHIFESLGVLVFHRLLPLHLVDHLVGGYVRASWRRLAPYVEGRRADLGPTFGEWFQWLAERLEEDPAPGKSAGAHVAHRVWRT